MTAKYEKDNMRIKHAAPLLLLLMTVSHNETVFEHHKSLNFKFCLFKTIKNIFSHSKICTVQKNGMSQKKDKETETAFNISVIG